MPFFTPSLTPRLYVAQPQGDDAGFLGYVLPQGVTPPPDGFDLTDAYPGTALKGSFVLGAQAPPLATQTQAQAVVDAVTAIVSGGPQAFVWLTDPGTISAATTLTMGYSPDGKTAVSGLNAPLVPGLLNLAVRGGSRLSLDGTSLVITPTAVNGVQLTGDAAPQADGISGAAVPLAGPQRGCVLFDIAVQRASLLSKLRWGFQFLIPTQQDTRKQMAAWYPLADGSNPSPSDRLGFHASIDPTDVENMHLTDRTYLAFVGQSVLNSYFRTRSGQQIQLLPVGDGAAAGQQQARLTFALSSPTGNKGTGFLMCPAGDFTLALSGAQPGAWYDLLCGLSGTETLSFQPATAGYAGDCLRFQSNKRAYAPAFPFPQASATGAPVDLGDPLTDAYRTSWGTILSASSHYNAQPKGAALYGKDGIINQQYGEMLGFMEPGAMLPQDPDFCFPLVPYGGVTPGDGVVSFGKDQLQAFEAQVIAPVRRAQITAAKPRPSASKQATHLGLAANEPYSAATPSGLIATVNPDGSWASVLLAQNLVPAERRLAFINPGPELQAAFQTSQLFLVAANAQYLGEFHNSINIEDWVLQANVGQSNQYNDYRNVLIIKGRKGKLADLVASPELWTQRAQFAAPGDPNELVIVSQWLQDYVGQALEQDSEFFDTFRQIATDENWTGILVLRADITTLPAQLQGLMAGLDRSRFNAHHLGLQISQIDGTNVTQMGSSSLFGLIYYVDPGYNPASGQPVPPAPGADYDFRVLELKALFENTSVKRFESRAQLTLAKLFGETVTSMGNPADLYPTVMLNGSYQNQGGQTVYVLDTVDDNSFYLGSNVLTKVEVVKAQFSTVSSDGSDKVRSRFDLWGFMDFSSLGGTANPFDVFSFGSPFSAGSQGAPRQGLRFSGLGVNMSFPQTDPQGRTFEFDASKIAFDLAQSTPRPASLFQNFALELDSLITGTKDLQPADQGYLQVLTDLTLGGVSDTWYGLRFRLNMGTPGELAGKVNLTAYLLLAWSPGSQGDSYNVSVGLALPGTGGGAKLLSLQGVMKLAIGEIRLVYVADRQSFLLTLTDIALKFLGLLKLPPDGSTAFYLFGNPHADGKASALGWYAVYNKNDQPA